MEIACSDCGVNQPPLANGTIRCNPFLALEVLLGGKICLGRALSPPLEGDSKLFSYMNILGGFYSNRLTYICAKDL